MLYNFRQIVTFLGVYLASRNSENYSFTEWLSVTKTQK